MKKRYFLLLIPAIIIYTLVLLAPTLKTFHHIFSDPDWFFKFDKIVSREYLVLLFICFLNASMQLALSALLAYLMIKSRESMIFVKISLVLSLIPIGVIAVSYLYFTKYNLGESALLYNLFGMNIAQLIMGNYFVNIFLIAFFSAIQWSGLHSLLYYLLIKNVPDEIYDIAKIDGVSGLDMIYHVFYPYARPIFSILTLAIMISSIKIFEISYVFGMFYNSYNSIIFEIWKNDYVSGETQDINLIGLLLNLILLSFLAILMVSKKIIQRHITKYLR